MTRKRQMGGALVDNAADPEQVKQGKVTERLRSQQHMNDLRALSELPAGRRVFDWFFELAGIYQSEFNSDSHFMAFKAGQRNIGLRVLGDLILAQPTAYAEMLAARATPTETP